MRNTLLIDPMEAQMRAQQASQRNVERLLAATKAQMQQFDQRSNADFGIPGFGEDSVQIGVPDWGADLIPDPRRNPGMGIPTLPEMPLASDPDFHNKLDAFMMEALDQISAVKAMERELGLERKNEQTDAEKGGLNVVAGNRSDGVKAERVTIHERGNWSTREHHDNTAGWNSHESRLSDGTIGTEYQVTVQWEDGTTTVRNVTLNNPNQTLVIDSAW